MEVDLKSKARKRGFYDPEHILKQSDWVIKYVYISVIMHKRNGLVLHSNYKTSNYFFLDVSFHKKPYSI